MPFIGAKDLHFDLRVRGKGKRELNRGVLLCETRRAVRSTLECRPRSCRLGLAWVCSCRSTHSRLPRHNETAGGSFAAGTHYEGVPLLG
jgi:hypothetical protein